MISPGLGYDGVPHAGGQYLLRLYRLLEHDPELDAALTVLVPDNPMNRRSAAQPGTPDNVLVLGGDRQPTLPGRALNALLDWSYWRVRVIDPGTPTLLLAASLLRAGPARTALEQADVVDLQWSESIRLAGLVRRLNPTAHVVGTFHDVQSQLFSRETGRHWPRRLYWRLVSRGARWHERRDIWHLDDVTVFSRKDALLLGDPAHARVVHPPLATGTEAPRPTPPGPPRALFVAHLARDENDKATVWLLTEIWPKVLTRCPEARLRIVGAGASEQVERLAAERPSVTLAGFVDDLEPEYAAAWACVVPLRQGAGVKFKTLEALLHDVPVVTTSVGAEGIEGTDLFAGLAEDASTLADRVSDVLLRPKAHQARSEAAQAWVRDNYGPDRFAAAIRASYGRTPMSR